MKVAALFVVGLVAAAALALGALLLAEPTVDPTTVTFEDLVEAGGEPRMDIFVASPGIPMRVDCVSIGDEAGSTAAGGALSYCKWRQALDSDLQEYETTYGAGPSG